MSVKFSNLDSLIALLASNNVIHVIDLNSLSLDSNVIHAILKDHHIKEKVDDVISDFFWIADNILLIVLKESIKWYSFEINKVNNNFNIKTLGCEKVKNNNWHISCPPGSISCSFRLLICSGVFNRSVEIYSWTLQNIANKTWKLSKSNLILEGDTKLEENELIPITIYQKHFLLVFDNKVAMANLYILDNHVKNMAELFCKLDLLNLTGRLATSVVDNLLVIHHQQTKQSLIFDILVNKYSDIINCFDFLQDNHEVVVCKVILPASISIKAISNKNLLISSENSSISSSNECEILSASWLFFQPNFVIETRTGVCWHLKLLIDNLSQDLLDYAKNDPSDINCQKMIGFFSRRRDGKRPMLLKLAEIINDFINKPNCDRLRFFKQLFTNLNEFVQLSTNPKNIKKNSLITQNFVLEEADLFGTLLAPILIRFHVSCTVPNNQKSTTESTPNSNTSSKNVNDKLKKRITTRIIETLITMFISSFNKSFPLKIEQFIDDLLYQIMVDVGRFNQLNQLLYYGIGYSMTNDTNKTLLAFTANSLSIRYKLASNEQSIKKRIQYEINDLISEKNFLDAINLAHSYGYIDKKNAQLFYQQYFSDNKDDLHDKISRYQDN